VKIVLPTDFARAYMWQRNAQISKIVYGTKLAIVVFAAPKQPIMVMGHKGQP